MSPKRKPTLLELARQLPAAQAKVKATRPGRTKADDDYVKPLTAELARELGEVVSLEEIELPRGKPLPPSLGKLKRPEILALAADLDPVDRVAERATLKRLLRARKVSIPGLCPTADLVWLAMTSGAFGKANRRTAEEG